MFEMDPTMKALMNEADKGTAMKNYITVKECKAKNLRGWDMGKVFPGSTFESSGEIKQLKDGKIFIPHIQYSGNKWIPFACSKLVDVQNPPTSDPSDFIGYARVRHYIEMPPYYKAIVYRPDTKIPKHDGGIPSVMQQTLIGDKKNPKADKAVFMTPTLRDWSFHLLELTAPEDLSRADIFNAWAHLYNGMVAFANKTGVDSPYGFYLQRTISHGTPWLRILRTFSKYGEVQAAFEVADAFDLATLDITPFGDRRHCLMPAVNWTKGWQNPNHDIDPLYPQGWAEPFSKLRGSRLWNPPTAYGGTHFVPMLGNHTCEGYIPLKWLKFLGTEIPTLTPYWKEPS